MNRINSDRSSVERGRWLKPHFLWTIGPFPIIAYMLFPSTWTQYTLGQSSSLQSMYIFGIQSLGTKTLSIYLRMFKAAYQKDQSWHLHISKTGFQRKYMNFVAFFLLQSMLNFRHLRFRLIKQGIFYEKQHFFALNSNIYFSNTRKSMTKTQATQMI